MTDKEAAHAWRLLQAQKLLDLYANANGHPARTAEELERWLASTAGKAATTYDHTPDGKIIP
jgi:hypothetical protein